MVETVGKFNRKVVILMTPSMTRGMDLLLETREAVGIPSTNPFMFAQVSLLHSQPSVIIYYAKRKTLQMHQSFFLFRELQVIWMDMVL